MFFIVIAGNFYLCTPYPMTFQVVQMTFDCERSSKQKTFWIRNESKSEKGYG